MALTVFLNVKLVDVRTSDYFIDFMYTSLDIVISI